MNKFITKLAKLTLGLAMAAGVGVAIGAGRKDTSPVHGAEVTYKLTIDGSHFNTTSYAANNNEKTTDAICTTDNTKKFEVKWTSYQVMKNGNNMQWQKSKGYIYNSTDLGTITSVTVTSSAGTFTTSYGTSEQPSSGSSGSGKGYFQTKVGGATGTTSKIEVVFKVEEGGGTTTYSLTYHSNEPSGTASGMPSTNPVTNITSGTSVNLASLPTLTGYTCLGWGETANSTTPVSGPITVSSNVNLYAIWEENSDSTTSTFKPGTNGYSDSAETQSISWGSSGSFKMSTVFYQGISYSVSSGTNTGKYYSEGIRLYGSESATFTVNVGSSNKIVSIKFTFTVNSSATFVDADDNGLTSNTKWQPDEESSSAVFHVGTSSGHIRLSAVAVEYTEKEQVTPTKTVASWASGTKTVYNGSNNNLLSTADVYVYEKDDSDKTAESYLTGIGFVLKIYKNGTLAYTLDASSSAQTQSFTGLDPSSGSVTWTVKATVGALTESSALTLTVVAKDTTSLVWATDYEQTGTFVSFAQKLHIDGRITGTFNDGSTSQDNRITTEIYSGNSVVAANLIYTRTVTKTTHNNGYDVTAATEQGKELVVDGDGYLAYTSGTTFYIQMYFADYPAYKVGKAISIVIPTLHAEDGNSFNYYVGTPYSTCVKNVSLKNGDEVVKSLNPTDVSLSVASVTPASTSSISVTVTYAATENFNLTTTYKINPVEPATLEGVSFFDNDGNEMDSSGYVMFTAGETFKLFDSSTLHESSTYFAYAIDSESNEYYIDSYADLTFELFDEEPDEDDVGEAITTSTVLRPSMDSKYVRGTYTQGSSSVSAVYFLYVSEMEVSAYSEGSLENYYEKVTNLSNVTSGDYIIAYDDKIMLANDAVSDYVDNVTISANRITHTDTVAKYVVHIVRDGDNISMQVSHTSDTHADSYINYTGGSNTLTFSDDPVSIGITTASSSNFDTYAASTSGAFAIGNGNNYLAFNSTSGQTRFRFYKAATLVNTKTPQTAYFAVDLYKRAGSPGTGDKITYLKEVIDAYRINSDAKTPEQGFSVCSEDSKIYQSDYWKGTNNKVSVKTLFSNLTSAELLQLGFQDRFGESGKTYVDTYNMLIQKESVAANARLITLFLGKNSNTVAIIVIISMVSVTAIGGYFFLRKRKEQ